MRHFSGGEEWIPANYYAYSPSRIVENEDPVLSNLLLLLSCLRVAFFQDGEFDELNAGRGGTKYFEREVIYHYDLFRVRYISIVVKDKSRQCIVFVTFGKSQSKSLVEVVYLATSANDVGVVINFALN